MKAKLIAAGLMFSAATIGGDWVEGTAEWGQVMVSIADRIYTINNDWEDSRVSVGVRSYYYETTMYYPLYPITYKARWEVFLDIAGNYQWDTQLTHNGAVVQQSSLPFNIGGSSGLPLTKREWKCEAQTATTWYKASSTSHLELRVTHRVEKASQYPANAPAYYNVLVWFGGPILEPGCYPWVVQYSSATSSVSVQRGGQESLEYKHTNLAIESIWGMIQNAH
jgi:hypothetical protein